MVIHLVLGFYRGVLIDFGSQIELGIFLIRVFFKICSPRVG